uniref:Putative tetratricopeptide-like helical domain-containing protein n=2 Tax=Helianthus annuus TaxID=4232 RepID=A0A251UD18_HELAN
MQTLSVCPSKSNHILNLESIPHLVKKKSRNHKVLTSLRGEYVCRYSRVNAYAFWGLNNNSFASSVGSSVVPLALAFEEQVVVGKSLNSVDDIDTDREKLDENSHPKSTKTSKIEGENRGKRVDTRALASSLRGAKTADDVELVLGDKGDLPLQVYVTIIRAFGKDKRVDSAVAVVEWLKRKRPGPNLFVYNSLLGAIKQAEEFDHVENVMNDMVSSGVCPNVVTYNTLMGISLAQGDETKALQVFNEIKTKGLSPSPASYSTALLAYRRMEDGFGALEFYVGFKNSYRNGEIGKNNKSEDWETEAKKLEDFVVRICYQVMRRWLVNSEDSSQKVLRLLTCMDQAGLQTGRSEHEKLIWACTRVDHYTVAKELYNRIRESGSEISLSVCNHVIWLLGKAKKWWAGLEIYEDLLDKGPKPNNMSYELIVSHFNFLLTAARKKGIWKWGIRLLNKMQEKGLKPGSKEWNSVLIACSKASEPSAAIQIFTRMIENGEKPTIISYGALLSVLEKGKLYDEALRVWKHMIKMGVEPNSYAYTIMASVYAAQGKFNIVESIIREMAVSGVELTITIRESGSEISLSVCNHVIWLLGKAKKWWAALEIYEDLLDKGPKPNNMSYELIVSHFNFLLTAARKKGIWKWGIRLLDKMQEKGLKPGSKEWNSVLIACSKASEPSAAIQIFTRMIENGEKPTIISYGALLSVLEKGKLYDEALRVWKHMIKMGVEPNSYAYTIMASVYAAQGKFNIVESIIREMAVSGVELTVVTFNAIITACARNNASGPAYEWFQRMEVEKIEPNEVSYEMLIEALANDGKPKLAYDMFLKAQGKGLSLSAKAYDTVVQAAVNGGATVDLSLLGPPPPAPVAESTKRVRTLFDINQEDMGIVND